MLYYQCYCCHSCCSFLHRITYAISSTVIHLLMIVVFVIYIYVYVYVSISMYIRTIVRCIHLIIYCMAQRWERWEQYKHTASLLLPLLLLLIVIYDGVGTYNETTMMVSCWWRNLLIVVMIADC